MKIKLLLFFCFPVFFLQAQINCDRALSITDQMPQFMGPDQTPFEKKADAEIAFQSYVAKHLVKPADCNFKGIVEVTVLIDKDGKIHRAVLVNDPGAGIGNAALALVNELPNFSPAIDDGTPECVFETLKISFASTQLGSTGEEGQIFKVVDQMPRFYSEECESLSTEEEKKQCATIECLKYVYKNVEYPEIARSNNVQGTVVVSFVVETDGSISNARLIRDIGATCGKASLKVIKEMPDWVPGIQNGEPVRVQYNLPIKFQLEQKEKN